MAESHGGRRSAQKLRLSTKKLAQKVTDTRVNIGSAFESWRELKAANGLNSDAQVAQHLLDGMKEVVSTPASPGASEEKIKLSQSEVEVLIEREVHNAVKKRETKLHGLIGSIQQQDCAVDYEGSIQKLEARINMVAKKAEAAIAYMTKTQRQSPLPSLDDVNTMGNDSEFETSEAATPIDKKGVNKSEGIFKMMETTKKALNEMRANNEALTAAIADLNEELPPPALCPPESKGLKRPLKEEPEHRQDIQNNTEESRQCEEPPKVRVKVECLSPGGKNSHENADSEQLLYPPLPTHTFPSILSIEAASYSLPQKPEVHLALIRKPTGLSVLWNEVEKDPGAPPMESYRPSSQSDEDRNPSTSAAAAASVQRQTIKSEDSTCKEEELHPPTEPEDRTFKEEELIPPFEPEDSTSEEEDLHLPTEPEYSTSEEEDLHPSTEPEDSTSGEEELHPSTPARGVKRRRGRGETTSPIQGSDQASTSGERWNDEDVPDIDPPQLIFSPSRTPGPQLTMTDNYTPAQLFQLFFTNAVLQTIVQNTNEYGSVHYSTPSSPWTDIDLQDMFCFLAMLIYMGVVKCASHADYWRGGKLYGLPFPKTVMTRNKFLKMAWGLHLSSAAMDAKNERKRGTAAFDQLGKIKPLYDAIRQACRRNYHPHQEISIDERMAVSKSRLGLHFKSNPVRWGYKLFVLADSRAGYTCDFFVYEGTSKGRKRLGYKSVMKLLKPQLLGTGYKLFVDSFYTSTVLFQDLLQMKVWACGTIRPSRIGFPRTTQNSLDSRSPRGSVRWIRKDSLLYVQWRDTKDVFLCSAFHPAHTGETIRRRVRGTDGKMEVKDITVPPVVKDYNKHMSGVELSDSLVGFYKVLHKTRKWYKTFFYHFLDIAIVNAYLLHKDLAKAKGQVPMHQKAFRETLAEDLARMGSASVDVPVEGPAPTLPPHHRLQYITGDSTTGRRKCKHCQRKCPVKCGTCNIPLCFVAGRDCYNNWHVANNFWR